MLLGRGWRRGGCERRGKLRGAGNHGVVREGGEWGDVMSGRGEGTRGDVLGWGSR